jgi:hypothetical protein
MTRFSWTTFDVRDLLPAKWEATLKRIAVERAVPRTLVSGSVTSREDNSFVEVDVLTVTGRTLRELCPWLYELYCTKFNELAELVARRPVTPAIDVRYGAVLNVQRGSRMRYECHVDSNPMEGLLYVTSHHRGSGGELAIARDPQAHSPKQIDADCDEIYPVAGHLVFFDARDRPHYVRALKDDDGLRVVVAMNFYTDDCRECDRPADLNRHLFGED